ncbi:esterase B1 [Bactrocera neohumeralis]|uniref:esterase B1 n=1 Tax=Bactrocera neohumeralis TaxID=98809 RepID=UPI0021661324|nr:esterase B1 [Bactrocera neohumeralis]
MLLKAYHSNLLCGYFPMLLRCSRISFNQSQRSALRYYSSMESSRVKVQVRQGVVVGREGRLPNGEPYHSFLGVPYAVPPLGELRFRSPVPLESFDTPILDCTREKSPCHQKEPMTENILGSEDCLHLNVYAPAKPSTTGPLPVMVWIHGGGFLFGSSNGTLPLSLISEDVIVVTLNYRLGAWGFLCLPEEGIWGNAGLKDQRLALQWVHDNISQFNGDPNNVTLFGESAGAASVHLHTLASHAHKLFHKAIMQSGSANMGWVFQINPARRVRRFCELLGCKSRDTRVMLNFLQSHEKVTPLDVLKNILPVLTSDERRRGLPFTFHPVVEDSSSTDTFIDTPVLELLQCKDTRVMPMIMGYNSAEGVLMLINAVRKIEEINNDLARFVPRNVPLAIDHAEIQYVAQKLRDFYFNGHQITHEQLECMTNLLTDYHFMVDLQLAVEYQAKYKTRSPLYFYRYDYTGGRDLFKRQLQLEFIPGACHADELHYLFQTPGIDSTKFAEKDRRNIKRLSVMWTNFARHGNPTPADSDITKDLGFVWQPLNNVNSKEKADLSLNCLIIDAECRMDRDPDKDRMDFWKEIYRSYPALDYSRFSAKL